MYSSVKFADNLYQIEDSDNNCASLIVGERRAVLFDTMLGEGGLKEYVESITDLPLTVINSHCHLDHIGGNCEFETVHINMREWGLVESIENQLELTPDSKVSSMPNCLKSLHGLKDQLVNIEPGEVLDLGGTTLEVIDLRGHTPGSIGLLMKEQRILLAGDAFSHQACLFFPESLSVEEYRQTLERAQDLPFDGYMLSHFKGMYPKRLLERFICCCDLPGNAKGYPFTYSLIPSYKGIIYFLEYHNPDADGAVCIITKDTFRKDCPN